MLRLCIECKYILMEKRLCMYYGAQSPVDGTFNLLCEEVRDDPKKCGWEGRWWDAKTDRGIKEVAGNPFPKGAVVEGFEVPDKPYIDKD